MNVCSDSDSSDGELRRECSLLSEGEDILGEEMIPLLPLTSEQEGDGT